MFCRIGFVSLLLLLGGPGTAHASSANETGVGVFWLVLGLLVISLYFLPTIIAFRNVHPNRWVIFALNTFLGASVIVWIICLIWANRAIHLSPGGQRLGGTDGGESGLNIFANDEKRIRLLSPADVTTYSTREIKSDIPTQLSKLKRLLDSGAITKNEFADLKRKVISNG